MRKQFLATKIEVERDKILAKDQRRMIIIKKEALDQGELKRMVAMVANLKKNKKFDRKCYNYRKKSHMAKDW